MNHDKQYFVVFTLDYSNTLSCSSLLNHVRTLLYLQKWNNLRTYSMYALIADRFYCCSRKKYVYNHNKQINYECLFVLITDNLYCCNNLLKKWKSMFIITIKQTMDVCMLWLQTDFIVTIICCSRTTYYHNNQTNHECVFVLITDRMYCWSSEKVRLWSQQSNKQWMFVCCDNLQIWSSFYTFKIVGLQNCSLLSMCSVCLYKHISYSRFSAFTGIQRPTDIPRTVVRREAQIWRLQR